ncbi:hypothetical protein ACE2AJ_09365 [Aquihabitans daechungensis]
MTYEWSAMIDPGWNLAIQRVGEDNRVWFWRSAELPCVESGPLHGPDVD